ncbi:hypothetical protein [Sphingomonas sp.]|uniref:hypothetical protein n=1 Tax=Sphingomonas sp. TaxID=28214 RepID=UPI003CC65264
MSRRNGLPFGLIGFGAVAAAGALLLILGQPRDRSTPRAVPAPEAPGVTVGGVTLTAVAADLPVDDRALPAGQHLDAVQTNCTACHSPAMILGQPHLTREQWQAEVEKMQKAYHAPIDAAATPAIMDYLTNLSGS